MYLSYLKKFPYSLPGIKLMGMAQTSTPTPKKPKKNNKFSLQGHNMKVKVIIKYLFKLKMHFYSPCLSLINLLLLPLLVQWPITPQNEDHQI